MVVLYLPIIVLGKSNSDFLIIPNYIDKGHFSISPEYLMAPGGTIIIDTYTVYQSGLIVDANYSLIIQDTLIVYGDLILGNGTDLIIENGAVCIVYGNVIVTNKIVMNFNSYFIVTGNLNHLGGVNNIDLDVDENASVYILGDVDEQFPTMVCDSITTATYDPPGNPAICERGDIIALEDNENNEDGLYDWIVNNDSIKGVTPVYSELCGSENIEITALKTDGINYQWCDSLGNVLQTGVDPSYIADIEGEYFVKIFDGTDTIYSHRAKVVTAIDTISPIISCATPVSGYNLDDNECFYTVTDNSLDPVSTSDNCGIPTVFNDFNSSSSLNGVQFPAGSTVVKWYAIDGAGNSDSCTYTIIVNSTINSDVGIIASPSTSICAGAEIVFSATPTNGGPSPSYQWKIDGIDIFGETGSVFTTSILSDNDVVTCEMTSSLSCVSTNPVSSNSIVISVDPVSAGGSASASQYICSGSSPADISIIGETGVIQWQSSTDNITFNDISGATASQLTSAQMGSLTETTYYRAKVTSGICVPAFSNIITITVYDVTITLESNSAEVCQGDNLVSFSYSATSDNPDEYSIDFDTSAEGQGFIDVSNSPLPVDMIDITVPAATGNDTFNSILTVKNSVTGCTSVAYNISIVVRPLPNTSEITTN